MSSCNKFVTSLWIVKSELTHIHCDLNKMQKGPHTKTPTAGPHHTPQVFKGIVSWRYKLFIETSIVLLKCFLVTSSCQVITMHSQNVQYVKTNSAKQKVWGCSTSREAGLKLHFTIDQGCKFSTGKWSIGTRNGKSLWSCDWFSYL